MDISAAKYVSVTTFRKNGVAVSTPVWIVRVADGRVGFTTDADAGKVKRVRNNPAVALRPCDMKGKIADGAAEVTGKAEIVTGAAYDEVWSSVRKKYGIIAKAMGAWGSLTGVFKRSKEVKTALLITLD
jgi:uncharacterized protein